MDEPTNHLDFDAINALIIALNNYEGGLVIVSHDQYFVSSVCDKLYVVKNKKVKLFEGDIDDYRRTLAKAMWLVILNIQSFIILDPKYLIYPLFASF